MNRVMALDKELEKLQNKPNLDDNDVRRAQIASMRAPLYDDDAKNGVAYRKPSTEFRNFLNSGAKFRDFRDMSTTDGGPQLSITGTGALIPVGFHAEVIAALRLTDQLLDVATWIYSRNGSPLAVPNFSDIANVGAVVSEHGVSTVTDLSPISSLVLPNCPTYRSGMIRVSNTLLQDAGVDLDAEFSKALGRRLGWALGSACVTALLAAADVAGTTAGATIAADEVVDMITSVNEAYATAPGAGWCMSLATLQAIRKLKNTNSSYYFPADEPDANGRQMLAGYPVYLCPSFPAVASTAKVLSFGDHSRFFIRQPLDKNGFWIRRYTERFAEMDQTAVEAFLRAQGDLMIAGGDADKPVAVLQVKA